ncbi:MAG: M20/M25/M40 family metallo-hydrolase [Chloroflexota bacterium]
MDSVINWIQRDRLIDLTKQMVAIPSVTTNEKAMGDWVESQMQAIGFANIQRLPVDESGDSLVAWTDGSADAPAMLVNFHLDTFPVCDGWETDPYEPIVRGNRLYGLGSHDMKGGGAAILGAVEAVLKSGVGLNGRLILACTTDEENWSRGAHAVIQTGLLENCQYGMIAEPCPEGVMQIGARGRHVFKVAFYGRTIHAAYGAGINAVTDASRVALRLADQNAIDLGFDERFNMPGSICVIGLQGGGTIILVPEYAELFIDRHILPDQTVDDAAAELHALIQAVGIESRYELSWDDRPTPAPTSYIVPPESHFVETVQKHMEAEQNRSMTHAICRSVADTNHFAGPGGVPILVIGPSGGNTCEANEYVNIDSIERTARVYAKSIVDLIGS